MTELRQFQEVSLSETEFKKAGELDSSEFANIRNEYFKRTFVNPLIGNIFAAVIAALWFTGVIQKLYVFSDVITTILIFLVTISITVSAYLTVRCIISLIFVSKINKKDFYWHIGYITGRARLWTIKFFRKDFYYIVDDEYCSRTVFDPVYRKGAEVYFLYFPGFWESSYLGGIVVRKK